MDHLRVVRKDSPSPGPRRKIDLMCKPEEQVEKYVPEHKRKRRWEPWHRTKALPISLGKIKGYYFTFRSDSSESVLILMWTSKPVVAQRKVCSKARSVRDLQRLNGKMIDDTDL